MRDKALHVRHDRRPIEHAVAGLEAMERSWFKWSWEAYFGKRVRTVVSTYCDKSSQLVERGVDPDALFNPLSVRERRHDTCGRTRARKRDPPEARLAGTRRVNVSEHTCNHHRCQHLTPRWTAALSRLLSAVGRTLRSA